MTVIEGRALIEVEKPNQTTNEKLVTDKLSYRDDAPVLELEDIQVVSNGRFVEDRAWEHIPVSRIVSVRPFDK